MTRYLGIVIDGACCAAQTVAITPPLRAAHDGVMLATASMTPQGLNGLIPWIAAAAVSAGLGLLLRKWLS